MNMKCLLVFTTLFMFMAYPDMAGASGGDNTVKVVEGGNTPLRAVKEYRIRVDGIACSYCAYGIEKKFRNISGVKFINIDFKKGIVSICTLDNVDFDEDFLEKTFKSAGFTYRSKEVVEQCTMPKK